MPRDDAPLMPTDEFRLQWHSDVITGRRQDRALLPSLRQHVIRYECTEQEELVVTAIEAFTDPILEQGALARIAIQLGGPGNAHSWPLTKLLTTTHPGGYELKPPLDALHIKCLGLLFVNVIHYTDEAFALPEPLELSIVLQINRLTLNRRSQQKGGD